MKLQKVLGVTLISIGFVFLVIGTMFPMVTLSVGAYHHLYTTGCGIGGFPSPLGHTSWQEGEVAEVTVVIDRTGYKFDYWMVGKVHTLCWEEDATYVRHDEYPLYIDWAEESYDHYVHVYFKEESVERCYLTIIYATVGGFTEPTGEMTHATAKGAVETVTAYANDGYLFNYWELDDVMYEVNPISVTMDTNHTLEAYWKEGVLSGKWFINGIEITSPTQEVHSDSKNVTFEFQKTSGTVIACYVEDRGTTTKLFDLTETATNTWTGTYMFDYGEHTLDLIATDGTDEIIMSVYSTILPEKPFDMNMIIIGVGLITLGAVVIIKQSKQKRESP